MHLKITKQKEVEDKAKALLSENRSYNKSELQVILCLKLGSAYKDEKVAELEQLHQEQPQFNPPDILLPPAPESPLDNTELGRAKQRQFKKMLES